MPVVVKGLRDVQFAFAQADRATKLGLRVGLRHVAEPIERDAEQLAVSQISGLRRETNPRWSKMRIGVSRTLVYVVPRQKGVRPGDPRHRPKFAYLMWERAMGPALERNESYVERSVEELLDHVADGFNEGGLP